MKNVQILDCTLRDGAYLLDKRLGQKTIEGIVRGLVRAKIDCIEIGFLQDEGFGVGKTVYKDAKDAKRYLPVKGDGCEFAVLADYSRYTIDHLNERDENSIDIVRECFFKNERYKALEACRIIKERGYKLFVQPVDILGYSDAELIELLDMINEIEPYCLSIVDTFGSMYREDLQRVFEIVNHNLSVTCKIGFHSHNNMQLSNALSQDFVRMSIGKREVVIDSTLSGMGRGAGNTPTELIAQYLVDKWGYLYDMDALLDTINTFMDYLKHYCSWGYSTPYFVAGCYSAHVNNISYLMQKNSIRYKDIRFILNSLNEKERRRYDYDRLEACYLKLLDTNIDDTDDFHRLSEKLHARRIVVLAPGSSVQIHKKKLLNYIQTHDCIVITANFEIAWLKEDYLFISSIRRIEHLRNSIQKNVIYTSNIPKSDRKESGYVISFVRLAQRGWNDMDNATMLLLRLLDAVGVTEIKIAGFDGYENQGNGKSNYAIPDYENASVETSYIERNEEIKKMFDAFCMEKQCEVSFLTPSRFAAIE